MGFDKSIPHCRLCLIRRFQLGLDTNGEEDSRGSIDQMSVSSACLNLDLFSSSSEDDSKDPAERSDLSITLFCDSDEANTRVNSDQVLSDGDFPEESVPRDKRQFVRRGASPPGGQLYGGGSGRSTV